MGISARWWSRAFVLAVPVALAVTGCAVEPGDDDELGESDASDEAEDEATGTTSDALTTRRVTGRCDASRRSLEAAARCGPSQIVYRPSFQRGDCRTGRRAALTYSCIKGGKP